MLFRSKTEDFDPKEIFDWGELNWEELAAEAETSADDMAGAMSNAADDITSSFEEAADAISKVFDIPDGVSTIQNAFDEFNNLGGITKDTWSDLVNVLGAEGAIKALQGMIDGTLTADDVTNQYAQDITNAANAAYNNATAQDDSATATENAGNKASEASSEVSNFGDKTEGAGTKAKLASTHTQSFAFGIDKVNTSAQSTPGVLSSAKGAISSLGDTASAKAPLLWSFANGLWAIVNAWGAYNKAKSGGSTFKGYSSQEFLSRDLASKTTNKPNVAANSWFSGTQVDASKTNIPDYLLPSGGSGGGGGGGGGGGSSSSTKTEDTWKKAFENELDDLKHAKEMDYITEKEYYDKLDALNKKYFANRKEYEDEYRKYEEEVI